MPKPYKHRSGKWCIHYSAKLSPTGKDQFVYYESEDAAKKDLKSRKVDREEHGKSAVTAQERQWVLFLRQQLGDLDLIPQVVAHWKATGSGSVTPTTVKDAVQAFQAFGTPKVGSRTASDIRWRLNAFAEAFSSRMLHQIHTGEIEDWLHDQGAEWSIRSFYKRLRPMFGYALRRRWIAEDPMERLKAPEVPTGSQSVYSGKEFQELLWAAEFAVPDYLLAFIGLAGFAWMPTSELVRLYSDEDVLRWEDIQWDRNRIHVRPTVGKATRRRSGNERFVPIHDYLQSWLKPFVNTTRTGFVVPVLHHDFAGMLRQLHVDTGVPAIHNGFRRSAISHYLAAHQDAGIGQLARWAGTSEQTIKRHYLESITPEAGVDWFKTWREK
jgi:integrase